MIEFIRNKLQNINAAYSEIHLEKRIITSLVLSNGEIEDINKKVLFNGNIRILNKSQWGFISFSNIENFDKYLEKVIKNNAQIAKHSDLKRKILAHKKITGKFKTTYKIDPFSISLDEKCSLLKNYDKILKKFKKVINRKINYLERREELYYGNSEGSIVSQEKTFTGTSVAGVAREGNNIQICRESWGSYAGYEIVKNHEEEVETIGRTAENLLKAEMIKGGKYDVIIDPKLSGVFAHEAFGHLSEADFIFENPEFKKIMRPGRKFGAKELNIIDDGNMANEAGHIFIDDEGIPPYKTYLIKNGIFNSLLHSRETAFKMKADLTGNARALDTSFQPIVRMTNTYIDKGKYSLNEILASVDDGIYAVDFNGGQTNLEMFTFSAGRGYQIKNGKIKKILKNVTLTGNVFDTLNNIVMIGNDLKFYGGLGGCGKGGQMPLPVATGGPHIKISNVLIGGV